MLAFNRHSEENNLVDAAAGTTDKAVEKAAELHEAANAVAIAPVKPVKLALVSSGLGNIHRGFEISTARWFHALDQHTDMDVRLFCGGKHEGGKQLWNFPRNSLWTRPFHYVPFMQEQQRWEMTYGAEQISFWSALNFELLSFQPDVIWTKDIPLAYLLRASRVAFNLNFKIIFANGGMLKPQNYADYDLVQQIENHAFDEALQFGIPLEKMELLSNCVPAPAITSIEDAARERTRTRESLGLEESDWVIVCVAAWNKYHKRIDYLLDEVGAIDDPNCKLLLCGAPEVDSDGLQEQGRRLLGDRVQWLNVTQERVSEILHAADVFVLPSLREHLGNAVVEAVLAGLPVVVHPHDGGRFVIEDEYWLTDLSAPGNLTNRLNWMRRNTRANLARIKILQNNVSTRFSAEALAGKFEAMVKRAANQSGSGNFCQSKA
ncbi:MAG: glycosyltransferase family 4 protein [Cyanobacteria bacterium REEB67]|nr:glycosyltransferase family 4 protein [Cyanobacteria bacterium REEB67]